MRALLIGTISIFLVSCMTHTSMMNHQMAQLEKVRKSLPAAVKVTCDKSSVYAYGYRSGDKGMSMNPSKLNHCVGENKQLLNDEYIKGYHAGVKAAQEAKKLSLIHI